MTADQHLSPTQFGFHPVPMDEWEEAADNAGTGQTKHIPTDTVLHTGQRSMYKPGVDQYAKDPGHQPYLPEVYHHEGRDYMGDGHHRVAAARQRGDKTIEVNYYR